MKKEKRGGYVQEAYKIFLILRQRPPLYKALEVARPRALRSPSPKAPRAKILLALRSPNASLHVFHVQRLGVLVPWPFGDFYLSLLLGAGCVPSSEIPILVHRLVIPSCHLQNPLALPLTRTPGSPSTGPEDVQMRPVLSAAYRHEVAAFLITGPPADPTALGLSIHRGSGPPLNGRCF